MNSFSDKTILITGATDGIGLALAKKLSKNNRLIVVGRSKEKLEYHFDGQQNVRTHVGDLSSLKQVLQVAENVLATEDKLDVLIHNASFVSSKRVETPEGNELQLAVNYLAPVVLTEKLKDLLSRSKGEVVFINSRAHKRATLNLADLQLEKGYSLSKAYDRSKLFLMLYAQKLAEELNKRNVRVNSLHPGLVNTKMGEKGCSWFHQFAWIILKQLGKSPKRAAENILRTVQSSEFQNSTGGFFGPDKKENPSRITEDKQVRNDLWQQTQKLLHTSIP